jgi:hypothetical protein
MASKTYAGRRSSYFQPLPPLPKLETRQPPSGALINAILEYADIQQPLGGSRVCLRVSERRMKDPVIKELLGRETRRLADVSVFWDEEEGEIIQVLDAGATLAELAEADAASEFDTFELTELALDYVARHQRRRRAR